MLPIEYSFPLPLDVGPASEDAPDCLEESKAGFHDIQSKMLKFRWGQAWFPGIGVIGGTLTLSWQSRHSLTDQSLARPGDTRHLMARRMHFQRAERTGETMFR